MKTHNGYEMIIAGGDCDGCATEYAHWLKKRYPSLKVTLIERQSGGSGLFDPDGNDTGNANEYWEKFCNN